MSAYARNPQTIPDDSVGGSSVREGVAEQNNVAINDLFTYLNAHANNEDGRSHQEIDEALDSIGDVSAAKDAAESAQVAAESARDKAGQWAENPEDVAVESGAYSAKHHALKAAASAQAAQEAAEDAQAATEATIASAGIPTIGGNGGKPLFAKIDESGMEYLSASAARDALGLGTAAVEDVGTDPGNVVQLDEEGKLPAVDGSALTGLDPGVAPGTILAFGGTTPPGGYLECDGATLSRTTYSTLFSAIGTAFGAGDGSTTFNLPDLRGEFVRGWDHGRGVDAGRALGSAQTDALQNITGSATEIVMSGSSTVSGAFSVKQTLSGGVSGGSSLTRKTLTLDASSVARTADETRPRNVALMYIIKY